MRVKSNINTDLQQELSERLEKVSWHSGYYVALCVFHDNTDTPAMFVYKDGFRCLGCGVWGSLEKLSAKLHGVKIRYSENDTYEISEKPDWIGWKNKYSSYKNAAIHAYKIGQEYPCLMHYLDDRGLSEIIKPGYIGYLDGWISFPVFNADGEFVDWVLRSTPSLETNIKYALRPRKNNKEGFSLYSADWSKLDERHCVYIPFGVLDMNVMHLCGYPTATGLTGKTFQVSWFDEMRLPIFLIPDAGEEDAAHKIQQQLGWRGSVIELDYPEGTKDVADIFTKYGKEKLDQLIRET